MIVSKSQSPVTLPEERSGRPTSCKIGDSVLYHSLLGLASGERYRTFSSIAPGLGLGMAASSRRKSLGRTSPCGRAAKTI